MIQFDEHIFQTGWNHQLVTLFDVRFYGPPPQPQTPASHIVTPGAKVHRVPWGGGNIWNGCGEFLLFCLNHGAVG